MSPKATWYWLLVAGGLFAFIFFYQRLAHRGPTGPDLILPKLDPAAVTIIQVRSGSKAAEIRAERTNGAWNLSEPMAYPAEGSAIEKLLGTLAKLAPATYLSETEVRSHPNADEDYGLVSPQASLILTQGNYRAHLLVGARTAPGDQVFLKVIAREGLYLVDSELLQVIPRTVEDWRDRDLLHLARLEFDHLAVTNNARSLVVRRQGTNGLWRMDWPLFQARADGARLTDGLRQLEALRVLEFVSDDPKANPETFGLQSPNLEVALAESTNQLALLQFGASPTNNPDQVYARRFGQAAIVTVPKAPLAAWQVDSANAFRDPHLLELVVPVQRLEAHGDEDFAVVAQTNGQWRIEPGDFPADDQLVSQLLSTLTNMSIVQFTKDVATPLNWPEFGLANPARRLVLETVGSRAGGSLTNDVIVELSFGFGTNQPDKVFVRRADEASVYAVGTNDFAQLPAGGWQLRERRIWDFAPVDLKGLEVRQRGKLRQLDRRGDHEWRLAPGSQGIIEEAAIEESLRNLLGQPAQAWVGVGQTNLTRFGFGDDGLQLTFLLKDGRRTDLAFGGQSPAGARYAVVTLDKELWIFELPWSLYRYILSYLSLPEGL